MLKSNFESMVYRPMLFEAVIFTPNLTPKCLQYKWNINQLQ